MLNIWESQQFCVSDALRCLATELNVKGGVRPVLGCEDVIISIALQTPNLRLVHGRIHTVTLHGIWRRGAMKPLKKIDRYLLWDRTQIFSFRDIFCCIYSPLQGLAAGVKGDRNTRPHFHATGVSMVDCTVWLGFILAGESCTPRLVLAHEEKNWKYSKWYCRSIFVNQYHIWRFRSQQSTRAWRQKTYVNDGRTFSAQAVLNVAAGVGFEPFILPFARKVPALPMPEHSHLFHHSLPDRIHTVSWCVSRLHLLQVVVVFNWYLRRRHPHVQREYSFCLQDGTHFDPLI